MEDLYLIEGKTLRGMANAIRAQKGTEGQLDPANYEDQILSIQGGGFPPQEKIVDLMFSGAEQIVVPDADFSLSKVVIKKPEALVASNIRFGVTIAGVNGGLRTDAINPQLHSPSIVKNDNLVEITNPIENGDFVKVFGCYNSGEKFKDVEKSPLNLQKIAHNKYKLTCRCSNLDIGFIDSEDSNSVELTVFAFADCTKDVKTTFDWKNNSSGMELSFKITANDGYLLPAHIDVICNGEELDIDYNAYTGEVKIYALELDYEGKLEGKGQLPTPIIRSISNHEAEIYSGVGTQVFDIYSENGDYLNSADRMDYPDDSTIEIGIIGLSEPQLVPPYLSIQKDSLKLVDMSLRDGDVLYSETYSVYADGEVATEGIDATSEQKTFISYNPICNFSKQTDGFYKSTNTGSQTYGLLRVDVIAPKATTIQIDYKAYTRSSYCFAYLGKIDCPFSDKYEKETSTNYYVAYTSSATNTNSYTQEVSAGVHSIYFKFYRGSSTSYTDRYLQVKVTEVTTE